MNMPDVRNKNSDVVPSDVEEDDDSSSITIKKYIVIGHIIKEQFGEN